MSRRAELGNGLDSLLRCGVSTFPSQGSSGHGPSLSEEAEPACSGHGPVLISKAKCGELL